MTTWAERLRSTFPGRTRTGPEVAEAPAWDLYAHPRQVPAAILTARDVADVQAAVRFAGEHGIALSMRGGGHSGAGFAAVTDGLMLDLSGLREVRVDPERRIAWAAPGATWGDYDAATQRHGLASTGGIVSSTGVAGLTLGGGVGALRGLHGLAVDNLRGAEVVLADGTLVRADADHEPELYWALRGGGGNFGVAVRLEFAVHPVSGVTTGLLVWPLDQAQQVAAAFRARAEELPDNTVADLVFKHGDDGEPVIVVIPRVVGGADEVPLIDDLRRAATPAADTVAPRSYTDSQRFLDEGARWCQRVYWNTTTLRHLNEEVVEVLADYAASAPSPASAINVEHYHGAISRADPASTAVGFRHARYNVFVEAKWDDPAADAENRAWSRELVAALEPHSAGGAYVSYLPRDADQARIRSAYGARNHDRLRAVKAAYDPGNLLRSNQNIQPAEHIGRRADSTPGEFSDSR
ncbi:FAD/FMN-containing dehydrogenase [Saccharopolyspora antimicrobica]|uniref:FAD/FMN-containing dehydrogenase n=1 Tax=Saccharopolyspora antimicrobica TaxID=455193 RepID=A0A1I5CQH4_9PSEU|nr:FAD-binding oxidoreductase [Saccharopolyspora antimicrobica]RKT88792.1 FAD/FMN-containing dehydrogenase [Saccharopolyspora antimicrobica]SFN88901.1 FAD/FMN-containing dehydrogenase [Saccharopolyspora antimicrobica]